MDDAPFSDDELCALALDADPEAPLDDDARPLCEVPGDATPLRLPAWYMPAPMGGSALRGWRRGVVALVIAAFLVITGFGLCNTYGQLHG